MEAELALSVSVSSISTRTMLIGWQRSQLIKISDARRIWKPRCGETSDRRVHIHRTPVRCSDPRAQHSSVNYAG